MSTPVTRAPTRPGAFGAGRDVATGRLAWLLLAVVVIATLAIGSAHGGPPTISQRIAYLEGVVKCPVCADVSIAQSNAQPAVDLRAKVVQLVRSGATDAQVERYVVAQYGTDEILRPSSPVIWIAPIAASSLAAAALLVALLRRRRLPERSAPDASDEAMVAALLGGRAAGRLRPGATPGVPPPPVTTT